jgi:hypothetical protein
MEPNMTTVVNIQEDDWDVYIGRGGQWGNPFLVGRDGTREDVINKYRKWILNQPKLLSQLSILKDKKLGCHCKPLACHCDVLVQLVEAFCD